MEYVYIVIASIVVLFATYGLFTIIGEVISNIKIAKQDNKGLCRCVLFVKDREKDIEYIVRRCMTEIGPFLGGAEKTMTIVDMGSLDETKKILAMLAEEYEEISIKGLNT